MKENNLIIEEVNFSNFPLVSSPGDCSPWIPCTPDNEYIPTSIKEIAVQDLLLREENF